LKKKDHVVLSFLLLVSLMGMLLLMLLLCVERERERKRERGGRKEGGRGE
jgi:hypothetical protein